MLKHKKAIFKANAAVVLFSAAGLFSKWIKLPAVYITFGRVFVSAVSLFIYCSLRKDGLKVKQKKDLPLLLSAGALLAAHWTLFFLSIQLSSVSFGTILFSSYPMFVCFLEPMIFREKLRFSSVAIAVLVFLGAVIAVGDATQGRMPSKGIIPGLVSAFVYALLSIINRRLRQGLESSAVSLYEQATAAFALLPVVVFSGRISIAPSDIALLVLLGVAMTAFAHTLFISSLSELPAFSAGVISSLESVYGILLAVTLLGEAPSLNEILGGSVIIASIVAHAAISSKQASKE